MKYRALVIVKNTFDKGLSDKQIDHRINKKIQSVMMHWDASEPVMPYYSAICPYSTYLSIMASPQRSQFESGSYAETLNMAANHKGVFFESEMPPSELKRRDNVEKEYRFVTEGARLRHRAIEPAIKNYYSKAFEIPEPEFVTSLHSFSVRNHSGMFDSYEIIRSARKFEEIETDAVLLPDVVFTEDFDMYEAEDQDDLRNFLRKNAADEDFVAVVECVAGTA